MSSLLDKKEMVKDEKKNKVGFIIVAIFLAWLIAPFGGNKFIQLSYMSYNVVHFIMQKLNITKVPDYIYFRNKAVYLAKISPDKPERAYKELDKAIELLSENENELDKIYRDKAQIRLFLGDKKGALEDLELINSPEAIDTYMMGLLYADKRNFEEADDYCRQTISKSYQTMIGYVCLANIQEKLGNINGAIGYYNLAIERSNNPKAYVERANLKRKLQDINGAQQDLESAKELSPYVDENLSIVGDVINPKTLTLNIK